MYLAAFIDGVDVWLRFNHYAGCFYNDSYIRAFSHLHLSGGGMDDLGVIGVQQTRLPVTPALIDNSSDWATGGNYYSEINNTQYVAEAGYFSTYLITAQSQAELTASGAHSGIHQYTCYATNSSAPCTLLVDVCHTTHDSGCPLGNISVTLSATPNEFIVTGMTKGAW